MAFGHLRMAVRPLCRASPEVSPPPRASNPRLSAGAFEVYSTFGTGGPISRWYGDGEPAQPLILTQSGGVRSPRNRGR